MGLLDFLRLSKPQTVLPQYPSNSQVKTDPHSPGMYRAYVPLQNVEAFYKAFIIQPNNGMYLKPENRVKIW